MSDDRKMWWLFTTSELIALWHALVEARYNGVFRESEVAKKKLQGVTRKVFEELTERKVDIVNSSNELYKEDL